MKGKRKERGGTFSLGSKLANICFFVCIMKSTHNNMEAKSKLTCLNVVIVASDAVIGAFFLWFVLVMLRVLLLCVALCDLLVILCVNYLCLLSLSIMAWLRIGSWECMLSL